jgi:hypothetical protein
LQQIDLAVHRDHFPTGDALQVRKTADVIDVCVTREQELHVFRLEPELADRCFDQRSGRRHAGVEQDVPSVVVISQT